MLWQAIMLAKSMFLTCTFFMFFFFFFYVKKTFLQNLNGSVLFDLQQEHFFAVNLKQ